MKSFIIPILIWFTHQNSLWTTLNSWLKFVNDVCYLVCYVISLIQKCFQQQKWSQMRLAWKIHLLNVSLTLTFVWGNKEMAFSK